MDICIIYEMSQVELGHVKIYSFYNFTFKSKGLLVSSKEPFHTNRK